MIEWKSNVSDATLANRVRELQSKLDDQQEKQIRDLLKNADDYSPFRRAKAIASRNQLWLGLLKSVDVSSLELPSCHVHQTASLPRDLRHGYRKVSHHDAVELDFLLTDDAIGFAQERGVSERRLRAGIAFRLMQYFHRLPGEVPVQVRIQDVATAKESFRDRFTKAASLSKNPVTVRDWFLASALGPLFAESMGTNHQRVSFVGGLYREFEKTSEGMTWTELTEDVLTGGTPPLVIAGLPRTGKTFTAYRLLYSIFCAGGCIHRITSRLRSCLTTDWGGVCDPAVDAKFQWYFFDDPFGTTDWENGVTAPDIEAFLQQMSSQGNTILTMREGLLRRFLESPEASEKKSTRFSYLRPRYITKWDSAPLRTSRHRQYYMEPYSLTTLTGMVLDYAAFGGAGWATKPRAYEQVRKKLSDYDRLMPADISVISNDSAAVSDRDEFLLLIKNPAVTIAGLADDIPFIFKTRERRVAFMLPTILRIDGVSGSRIARLLGISPDWAAATQHGDDTDPQVGPTNRSGINEYLRVVHPAYHDCFALYSRRARGIADLASSLEFLFNNLDMRDCDSQTFVLIADLIRFRMMCELRVFRELVADEEEPDFRPWLSGQIALGQRIEKILSGCGGSQQEGVERLRVVYEEFSCLEEFLLGRFPSVQLDERNEHSSAGREVTVNVKTRTPEYLRKPASVSATGFVLQDILRLCTESDPLSIISGSRIESFINDLFSLCAGDVFSPFETALCVSTIVGGIVSPWGEQPVADRAISRWLGKLCELPASNVTGQVSLLTLCDILVWKISDFSNYVGSPRRVALTPQDLGFGEVVRDPPDPKDVAALLSECEGLLNISMDKLEQGPEGVQEYSLGWMLFTLLWHNDWSQRSEVERASLQKLWEKCLREWGRICTPGLKDVPLMQRGFFDNAEYHRYYHELQEFEWSQRTALRTSPDDPARIGATMFTSAGVAKSRGDMSSVRVWKKALSAASGLRRVGLDKTWTERLGTSGECEQRTKGAFHSVLFLIGCRACHSEKNRRDENLRSRCYDPLMEAVLLDTSPDCALTPGVGEVMELLTKQSGVDNAIIIPKHVTDLNLVQPKLRQRVETLRKYASEVAQ